MDDLSTGDSPTVASALPGAGNLIAGRYRLRGRLGRGASKEVYLAHDERLDRDVALAIVVGAGGSDSSRARVAREARVTGRLGDHPNVITVYDTGELEGVPYLVLRAMPGGSLADALGERRPPLAQAIRIGREIATALAHAHAHGVVHRDVKPDNVWLTGDGGIALGDFGVAHEVGGERLTAEGLIVGTVRYLSPEQIQGGDVGPASDLYALGVTLYELVTGRPPFTAAEPAHVLAQHLAATPAPPSVHEPAVPPELERLILQLLAKRPEERPASAAAVADALGAISAVAPRPPAARRMVAILVVRAEGGDPEAVHGLLADCAAAIERHGGAAERQLGDALVGLFGTTVAHGDEALRAARAAVELRDATTGLRQGIETGEVFLDGVTAPTGAAITAAARLAERAEPGEILLGERVRKALAPDASLDAGGGRLLALHTQEPGLLRRALTPFVGRERELERLRAELARVRDERTCRLVTVAGPPGVGKSRLAGELVAVLGEGATVLAGRCRAYGEGTTYGPLADIVRGLGGGDARRRLEELLEGDAQALRALLGALGLADEPVQPEETAWAVRRLLERCARERPLVVAIEDIHWAQPALLDLLDHVAALSTGAPILLLCMTRPELLEERPGWAAPQPNRSILVLEGLDGAHARELAERLGAGERASGIAQRAEGNPLFVEQLVAVDAAEDELPASIHAVLAARIDRLEAGERTLLQHAAVEGRMFHAGALEAILGEPERSRLRTRLVALARRGLIGADRPDFAGEDAFRFTHALIREAAYAGVPKQRRADLHVAVAEWLAARPGAPDEVVGHHLEQACRLAAELGRTGERQRALGARAAERLEAASRAALARGDPAAACALLERALALVEPDAAARGALLPALGAALFEAGRMADASRVLDEAIAHAAEPRQAARACVEREFVRLEAETSAGSAGAARVAGEALAVLEGAGDNRGQCRAWSLRAQVAWIAGRVGEADQAWRRAAECAPDERELFAILGWRATAAVLGPAPVDEAIAGCEAFRDSVSASPVAVTWIINPLASLHAMRGDFELADRLVQEANATLSRLGSLNASVSHHEALVRLLAGQPAAAEAPLRAGVERLSSMSDRRLLATTNAMLAQADYAQGRVEEAGELCEAAAAGGADDDIVTQAIWRGVKAKVLAHAGRCEPALALAREAVALVAPTDLLSHSADAMLDLAKVLRACSRTDESEGTIRAALSLYEEKGNVVGAARARSLLDHQPGAA